MLRQTVVFLSALSLAGLAHTRPAGETFVRRDESNGAVASEVDFCSDAGADMLKKGGNAADAIVANVFCVGVAGMYHSGIGGGGFALVRTPEGKHEFIDFREKAPAAASEDMFTNDTDASIYGGLASGVPGQVRGLEHLHKNYGSLDWSTVLEPSIRTAREGWAVNEDLAQHLISDREFLVKDPAWAADFAPNGTLLGLGDTITRHRLADTLEAISTDGAEVFHTGDMAQFMVNALQKTGGIMTMDDMKKYNVEVREPVEIEYRGFKIASTSAPSSGAIGLNILNTVDEYDDFFVPDNIHLSTHRLDEAMKHAYGRRTKFGDPSFVDGLDKFQREIITDEAAAEIREKIDDDGTRGNISYYDPSGEESLDTPGTSHMVAVDGSGLAISLTTTVNLIFGSELMVPETGVIMNNEMNDFSIPGSSNEFGFIPSPTNYARPAKRMLSSMCPMIVSHPDKDGKPGDVYLLTGAAGGSRIITSTIQSIINVIDRNMTAPAALEERRQHDQLVPQEVTFEKGFDEATVKFMVGQGHNVTWVDPGQSSVQAIRVLDGDDGKTYEPASEPRQINSGGSVVGKSC